MNYKGCLRKFDVAQFVSKYTNSKDAQAKSSKSSKSQKSIKEIFKEQPK